MREGVGEDGKMTILPLPKIKRLLSLEHIRDERTEPVEQYMRRFLTMGTDKLPAMSGLANIYHQQIGDTYLAGLWRKDLMQTLLWCTEPDPNDMPGGLKTTERQIMGIDRQRYRFWSYRQ